MKVIFAEYWLCVCDGCDKNVVITFSSNESNSSGVGNSGRDDLSAHGGLVVVID